MQRESHPRNRIRKLFFVRTMTFRFPAPMRDKMFQSGNQISSKHANATVNAWLEKLQRFWLRHVLMPLSVRHVYGKRRITYARNELIVVTLVRNAEAYINSF